MSLPVAGKRHMKRVRPLEEMDGANAQTAVDGELEVGGDASIPANRTVFACQACRMRKTRCVGFPICAWCRQRNQPCLRTPNSQTSPLDDWGQQILDAINTAKGEVIFSITSNGRSSASCPLPPQPPELPSAPPIPFDVRGLQLRSTLNPFYLSRIANAEGILGWEIFKKEFPGDLLKPLYSLRDDEFETASVPKSSADTSLSRLQYLRRRFGSKFLNCHPIIRGSELDRSVRNVAESGGLWDAETCLVFLMCALASRCCSDVDVETPDKSTVDGSPLLIISPSPSSLRTSFQYWTMAKRRLGWAIDSPESLLSAQCLCLTGFWHLRNNAPRRARNMFHQATVTARNLWNSSTMPLAERPLARLINLISFDIYSRLSFETDLPVFDKESLITHGSSFLWEQTNGSTVSSHVDQNPSPFVLTFNNELAESLQELLLMRLEILQVLALLSSSSSWLEFAAVLGRIQDLRTRLHGLIRSSTRFSLADGIGISPSSYLFGKQEAGNIETNALRYRRELVVLLRSSLYLFLLPSFSTSLSYGSPPHPTRSELSEITSLACECVKLVVDSIQSYLQNWNAGDPQRIQGLSSQGPVETTCYDVEAWLSHRSAFAGCILLLGAFQAKSRAFQTDIEFSHCLGLVLPEGWRDVVTGVVRLLLTYDNGSTFWHYGQQLQRLDTESRKSENNPY